MSYLDDAAVREVYAGTRQNEWEPTSFWIPPNIVLPAVWAVADVKRREKRRNSGYHFNRNVVRSQYP
jgi:hypothetical protein